jgi:hypothetical protein
MMLIKLLIIIIIIVIIIIIIIIIPAPSLTRFGRHVDRGHALVILVRRISPTLRLSQITGNRSGGVVRESRSMDPDDRVSVNRNFDRSGRPFESRLLGGKHPGPKVIKREHDSLQGSS